MVYDEYRSQLLIGSRFRYAMHNPRFQNKFFSPLILRFRQVLWLALGVWSVVAIRELFLADHGHDHFSGVFVMCLLHILGVFLLVSCIVLLNKGKEALASAIFVCSTALFIVLITWQTGGISSTAIASFPVLLILAATFSGRNVFVSLCVFLMAMIVFLEMNVEYEWSVSTADSNKRMAGHVFAVVFSALISWLFANDMKKALHRQSKAQDDLSESNAVIEKLAYKDSLTGLWNRESIYTKYAELVSKLDTKDEQRVFLYFIDLDNFKAINDLFDHNEGDKLLKSTADRLTALIGENDLAFRLGGDEFLLMLRADQTFSEHDFITQLMTSLAKPYVIRGTLADVTASVGITSVSDPLVAFDDVRKQADMSMIKAKQSGKNEYQYYNDELSREYTRNLNTVHGLKEALANDSLDLHFQPKFNLANKSVEGAEALLRWSRGNPDLVQPGEFFSIIESTELVHEIGAWVIKQSCLACKQWHDEGHYISVSVNVSVLQLTRQGFSDLVIEALEQSKLKPDFLEIELNEHLLLHENQSVKSQLKLLKAQGVKLVIDDFGSGYSNMSDLTRLEVDTLKLDHSFVSKISDNNGTCVVVTAIIEMARVLGISVVAEGVERESECVLLEKLGCKSAQGFLWSKAISSRALLHYLESYKAPRPVALSATV